MVQPQTSVSRREFLARSSVGIGSAALASLLAGESKGAPSSNDVSGVKRSHFMGKAKNVIFFHMVGAPSQLDLFDYKPILNEHDGKLMPDDLWKDLRLAFIREQPNLLGTPFQFRKWGESGNELSELLPHLGAVADELAVIKSMHTEQINHGPAQVLMQTGFAQFGRPCIGAWTSYGLGSLNRDLPVFVVMNTGTIAGGGNSLWGSGFLPSVHQGVEFRSSGDPVLFLSNPAGMSRSDRGRIVSSINHLNRLRFDELGDPEIATRISQYEMAYRMQAAVPELMDVSGETEATHKMYGTEPGKASFANNCLLARRLVERGVRFVQLYDSGWDMHSNVFPSLKKKCRQADQPIAALIKDLKQRGLLDETLVIWGAEFGRTPMLQLRGSDGDDFKKRAGRDHHKHAFSIWMAGGGVKPGITYGKTDDLGFSVVEDPMHVNDFHATLLHLLGLDHEQLTYTYQGRKFRLTDVGGNVAEKLLA